VTREAEALAYSFLHGWQVQQAMTQDGLTRWEQAVCCFHIVDRHTQSWRSPMAPHSVAHEHATCSGWLAREDPEWAYAWSYFPDPVMAHPVSGECLQYMGSAQYPGRGWVHVFRHRQVPGSDLRQHWQVPASVGWQPVPQRQG